MGRQWEENKNIFKIKTEKARETNRDRSIEEGRWETSLVAEDKSGEGWERYSDDLCTGLSVTKMQKRCAKTESTQRQATTWHKMHSGHVAEPRNRDGSGTELLTGEGPLKGLTW